MTDESLLPKLTDEDSRSAYSIDGEQEETEEDQNDIHEHDSLAGDMVEEIVDQFEHLYDLDNDLHWGLYDKEEDEANMNDSSEVLYD